MLVAAALCALTLAQATPPPSTATPAPEQSAQAAPEPVAFSEVVPVEGASAADLYNRAKLWFAKAFVDSNRVLQVQDKEAGTLVGKGAFQYEPNVLMNSSVIRGTVRYSVTVMVKDGRYKYVITDFVHEGTEKMGFNATFGLVTTAPHPPDVSGTSKGVREKVWKHLKDVAEEQAKSLSKSLKEAMAKPGAKDDAW